MHHFMISAKNKFTPKESNITIVYVSTIFQYLYIPAECWHSWATGTERAVNPTTQTYLVATAYPKHIVKLGQPKPARAPNRMVCTAARSAWALRTIGRAVLCDAHSRE
jgi:hypothetical protein